jgi:hypothetical protein
MKRSGTRTDPARPRLRLPRPRNQEPAGSRKFRHVIKKHPAFAQPIRNQIDTKVKALHAENRKEDLYHLPET